MTEILKELNEKKIGIKDTKITPDLLAKLLSLLSNNKINTNGARAILPKVMETGRDPESFIEELGLAQISNEDELIKMIDEVITANQKELQEYLSGKDKLFAFFVGQVMKKSKGKANPKLLNELMKKRLDELKTNM